jgi:hypothetical protein
MSNASVNYIGAVNQADSTLAEQRAIYLKIFSGEVITAFKETTSFLDKHNVRTITSGKEAQFPLMGRMPAAEYHVPGEEILGQKVNQAEKTISIDKLLISHIFLSDIDEAMSHFEVRSKYAQEMGNRLARTFDNHVCREIVSAARASNPVSDLDGGKYIENADFTSATAADRFTAWVTAFEEAAVNFDNKEVPDAPRYCAVTPATWYFLHSYMNNNGWSMLQKDIGGRGSIADANTLRIYGIDLFKTTNLANKDYESEDFHAIDCSTTQGVIFTPDAVGTVKLMDLSLQSEWDIRRQGTLMVARYAMGHDWLRPECAVELRTAGPDTDDVV